MKLAIMQPYFMPYIGYWQLIGAVDLFVLYNDVNFIKKGYINRNKILINQQANTFTIPLIKTSQNKLINEVEIAYSEDWVVKLLKKIEYNYKKAPYFSKVFSLLEDALEDRFTTIDELCIQLVKSFSNYLQLSTKFLISSELKYDRTKKGQHRILDLCKLLGAETYINPIGGQEIYSKELFTMHHIDLFFINCKENLSYRQFEDTFTPNLSMIDVLMFNSQEETRGLLNEFNLK